MEDLEYIKMLLRENEGEQMAFFSDLDLEKIAETVCAFLNSNGGRILIGIDKHKKPVHIKNISQEFNALKKYLYEKIIPESLIGIRKEEYKEETIILVEVIEGIKKPYSFNNHTFIREKASTRLADDSDMSGLIRHRRRDEYSWERSPALEVSLNDLDLEEIKKTIELSNKLERSSKFKADDPLHFLSNFQLYKNNQFTNAAIVLFGKEPTYFLPQCRIRIIDFGKGKTSDRFEDTVLIEDNLFKAFEKIHAYFKKNLPMISEFSDTEWKRNDRLKYPMKAIDEGVINAMMHRDYSDATGEVFIGIYSDKIEIINSGELPANWKDADLKKTHRSIPPNPGITHIVYLTGMIEKVGRGTILINELFEELGLEAPYWLSKDGATTLTLHGTPKKIEVNQRMHDFLNVIKQGGSFTREQYEKHFKGKISERTARGDLNKLVEGGWIDRVDDGSLTKYVKNVKKLPDVAG